MNQGDLRSTILFRLNELSPGGKDMFGNSSNMVEVMRRELNLAAKEIAKRLLAAGYRHRFIQDTLTISSSSTTSYALPESLDNYVAATYPELLELYSMIRTAPDHALSVSFPDNGDPRFREDWLNYYSGSSSDTDPVAYMLGSSVVFLSPLAVGHTFNTIYVPGPIPLPDTEASRTVDLPDIVENEVVNMTTMNLLDSENSNRPLLEAKIEAGLRTTVSALRRRRLNVGPKLIPGSGRDDRGGRRKFASWRAGIQ